MIMPQIPTLIKIFRKIVMINKIILKKRKKRMTKKSMRMKKNMTMISK